jgi:hypothetical protein
LTRPEEKSGDKEGVAEQSNILGCTERTGSSHKIHTSICYQEQYYCSEQQTESSRRKEAET